jgi:hypothetical protein
MVTQIALGGDRTEVLQGSRLGWDALGPELNRTLELLGTADGRVQAIRGAGKQLVAQGQGALAETLARTVRVEIETLDRPEIVALVGLELAQAGQTDAAKVVAANLIKPFQVKPTARYAGKRPPYGPNLLALLIALGQAKEAEALTQVPVETPPTEPYPEVRLGYALGLACQEKWPLARQFAECPGLPRQRMEALLAVAEVALAKHNIAEARQALEPAIELAGQVLKSEEGKSVSGWLFVRLLGSAAEAGLPEDKLRPVADAIPGEAFRARAGLEMERSRLQDMTRGEISERLEKEVAAKPSSSLLLELLARELARRGSASSLLKGIARWEPPALRAFGYAGAALGEQDQAPRP